MFKFGTFVLYLVI